MLDSHSTPSNSKPENELFPELNKKPGAATAMPSIKLGKSLPPPPPSKRVAVAPAIETIDATEVEEEPEEGETLDARDVSDDADDVETVGAHDVSDPADDVETVDARDVQVDEAETLPLEAVADADVEDEKTPAAMSALDALGASVSSSRAILPRYDAEVDDGPTVALPSSVVHDEPVMPRSVRPMSLPRPSVRPLSLPPIPTPRPSQPALSAPVPSARVPGALLRSGSPASVPPPASAQPAVSTSSIDSGRLSIPPVADSVLPPPPQARAPSRWPLLAAAAALLVVVGGGAAAVGARALGLGASHDATIVVTAAGASGKALDGVRILVDGQQRCASSPCRVDGLTAGTHIVQAEAPGHEPTAGRAVAVARGGEAALHVELVAVASEVKPEVASAAVAQPLADAPPASASPAPIAKGNAKPVVAKTGDTKAPAAAKPEPAAQGTLNINSIPRANVVVNGRPMGMTPVMGLSVAPGPQTVVFVHPELGRKVGSANVQAGGSATIAVRFE